MTSATSPTAPKGQYYEAFRTLGFKAADAGVAAGAISLVWRDYLDKSRQQAGQPVTGMSYPESVKAGLKEASWKFGLTFAVQIELQKQVKKRIVSNPKEAGFKEELASSAVVGAVSSPLLAIINGASLGWGPWKSLRMITPQQVVNITGQEGAFVAGVCCAAPLSTVLKKYLGDNKGVEYGSAYLSGGAGALAGHPFNTRLTRGQMNLPIENFGQLWWGAAKRANAIGKLNVLITAGTDLVNYATGSSKS